MFQNNHWPFGIGGGEAGGREARWEDVSVIQMRDDKGSNCGLEGRKGNLGVS